MACELTQMEICCTQSRAQLRVRNIEFVKINIQGTNSIFFDVLDAQKFRQTHTTRPLGSCCRLCSAQIDPQNELTTSRRNSHFLQFHPKIRSSLRAASLHCKLKLIHISYNEENCRKFPVRSGPMTRTCTGNSWNSYEFHRWIRNS